MSFILIWYIWLKFGISNICSIIERLYLQSDIWLIFLNSRKAYSNNYLSLLYIYHLLLYPLLLWQWPYYHHLLLRPYWQHIVNFHRLMDIDSRPLEISEYWWKSLISMGIELIFMGFHLTKIVMFAIVASVIPYR